jgi:hypothetical protein
MKDLKVRYPQVQLTDELFVGEGGNVIDSFVSKVQSAWSPATAGEGRHPKWLVAAWQVN